LQHLPEAIPSFNLSNGYIHGPLQCRLCFSGTEKTLVLGDWRLRNNPGYYGSSDPEILILGFSKGANQNKAATEGDFDRVAFAGARHRLRTVLETLNIMPSDRSIDDLMTAREKKFGVASLVRCSLCKMKDGVCKTSGDVIPSAFANTPTLAIIRRCATTFLGKLPSRVRLVVLLGTSDSYIVKTQSMFLTVLHGFFACESGCISCWRCALGLRVPSIARQRSFRLMGIWWHGRPFRPKANPCASGLSTECHATLPLLVFDTPASRFKVLKVGLPAGFHRRYTGPMPDNSNNPTHAANSSKP